MDTLVRSIGLGLLIALQTGVSADSAPPTSSLKVLHRWHLGGSGGWDYLTLDSTARRLFVSRGTRVDVVDTQSGKILGTIADTN